MDWAKALKRMNFNSYSFPIPLGKWVARSPRIWRVFYDQDENCVEVLSDEEGLIRCDQVRGRTFRRGESMGQVEPNGLPATVEATGEDILKLFCTCETQFHEHEEETQSFLERLKSWGGAWMWEGLNLNDNEDISWVAESLKNKSIVCVTDGSYMKEFAPDLCSAGWIVLCKQTGQKICGHLVERSPDASSYRGELLGMLAIRLFLLAVEEHFEVSSSDNGVCCDNKGALYTFGKKSKRVPSGKANTDIQRVLRSIQSRSRSSFRQHHVKAHQDEVKKWERMTLEEKLNYHCDDMAKKAIKTYAATRGGHDADNSAEADRFSLPLEAARVFVDGVKQTTDVGKGLKHHIGRHQRQSNSIKRRRKTRSRPKCLIS